MKIILHKILKNRLPNNISHNKKVIYVLFIGYAIVKPLRNGFTRPVIIHRAIFGSLERFIAILCEHTGGKWDFWISPRQIKLITIGKEPV